MRDSKETRIFICEYALKQKKQFININDSIHLDISECYLEYAWQHTKDYKRYIIPEMTRLVIRGEFSSYDSFHSEWQIGEDTADANTWYGPSGPHSMIHNLDSVQRDSIKFLVFTGDWIGPYKPKKILGAFTLYKQK